MLLFTHVNAYANIVPKQLTGKRLTILHTKLVSYTRSTDRMTICSLTSCSHDTTNLSAKRFKNLSKRILNKVEKK